MARLNDKLGLLQSVRGHVMVELAAVSPLFFILSCLVIEYGKFHDDSQRAAYITREMLSVGTKICGGKNTIDEIQLCLSNGDGKLQPKLEQALLEASPTQPIRILITQWRWLPRDPPVYGTLHIHRVLIPFGHAGPLWDSTSDAYRSVTSPPDSWLTDFPSADRILTRTFSADDRDLYQFASNRCKYWVSEEYVFQNQPTDPDDTIVEKCGVVTAEGWIRYRAVTPLGRMIQYLLSIDPGATSGATGPANNVASGSNTHTDGKEIYIRLVL